MKLPLSKDGLFPLNIFFPVKVSDLSSALGPAILIIILLSIYSSFKNLRSKIMSYVM